MSILSELGYGPFFSAQIELLAAKETLTPARVVSESHGIYELAGASIKLGELSGKLRERLTPIQRPVTGDWVALSESGERAVIQHVLDRRTLLKRRAAASESTLQTIAANVDLFFIVTSANDELNPRRIERYLSAVWDSGAEPVVVLNKVDLLTDTSPATRIIEAVAPAVDIVQVSAVSGIGLEQLNLELRPGRTVGLIGSSGVGKSSLTNCLLGRELQATHDIGWASKGRHTTSQRALVVLPGRGVLLDTPGMRELGLIGDESSLDRAFADIAEIAAACRFRNCQHDTEPGCAVLEAVRAGSLPEARLTSLHKLRREMRAAEAQHDPRLAAERRRYWKVIAKNNRKRMRDKR